MPKHNTRYSCMEKPRVNQFCSQCYCMRLPWPQSWYPVLDEWTINELILGHCILHRDSVPRCSKSLKSAAWSDLWNLNGSLFKPCFKLETWIWGVIVLDLFSWVSIPSVLDFVGCLKFSMDAVSTLEEVITNNELSPKKNFTAVQLSIFFNFESECYQFILFQYDFLILYHPDENTTWQWKIQNLKMYFPLKNGDFPMSF